MLEPELELIPEPGSTGDHFLQGSSSGVPDLTHTDGEIHEASSEPSGCRQSGPLEAFRRPSRFL